MLMIYMCEISENIAKKGGIDFTVPEIFSPYKSETQTL